VAALGNLILIFTGIITSYTSFAFKQLFKFDNNSEVNSPNFSHMIILVYALLLNFERLAITFVLNYFIILSKTEF
jgi:hypothetical protein